MPENGARYMFHINQVGENQIQIQNNYQINQTIYSGVDYPYLKKFNEMIVAKEAEQIVLKKIN